MRHTLFCSAAMACALALASSADAEPLKTRVASSARDTNIDWSRPKLSFGVPHIKGAPIDNAPATIAQLTTPFALCYTRAIIHGWKREGDAQLVLELDGNGGVTSADMFSSAAGFDSQVVDCWTAATRRLRFSKPSTGPATVNLALAFGATHAPPHRPKQPPRYPGKIEARVGTIVQSGARLPDAARVVADWQDTLAPCAAHARSSFNSPAGAPSGVLEVRLRVGPNGRVSNVAISRTSILLPMSAPEMPRAVDACVKQRAARLQFTPHGPGSANVRFSVMLTRVNDG